MYLEDFLNDEIKKEFDQQELEKNLCDYNIYNNKYDDRIEYLEKMGIISFIFGIIIIFIYTINVIT